ncbi:MAG: 16S rRNA (uracil(1498)-N(3))-methyltransferase [Bacteroidetes bacterium GWF2_49_14]|nr:MAG: 16S rRNA (uracil(1498)-N(3))-methyltransferase [Bacteroidetes bacterium GWF2_49_14]
MNLFYAPELADQEEIVLSAEESHHAVRVLRISAGEQIILVNGKGGWYTSKIVHPDPKACRVEIISREQGLGVPRYHLHIAMAPTKQIDRFEWFIEKATEIGISEITPLICDRSERRDVKPERLVKVAISAMKQSLKAFHPVIHPSVSLRKFLAREMPGSKGIAHCVPGTKLWLNEASDKTTNNIILIGPEGDFTPDEIQLAYGAGYSPITLGESRLRTETAGVVAVQTLAWLFR